MTENMEPPTLGPDDTQPLPQPIIGSPLTFKEPRKSDLQVGVRINPEMHDDDGRYTLDSDGTTFIADGIVTILPTKEETSISLLRQMDELMSGLDSPSILLGNWEGQTLEENYNTAHTQNGSTHPLEEVKSLVIYDCKDPEDNRCLLLRIVMSVDRKKKEEQTGKPAGKHYSLIVEDLALITDQSVIQKFLMSHSAQ